MDEEERVIREWADATCRVDVATMGALLAPDAVTIDDPSTTRYFGLRGFLEYARQWWTGPFTFRIVLSGIHPGADRSWDATFTATVTHVGTFTSRWGNAAPTGNQFSFNVVQRCTIVDGRITELRVIYNLAGLLRAIGITPPRA